MKFTDAVAINGTRRREDGSLIVDARVARTGVQNYLGSELERPDMSVVRVYRPGSEVFSEGTMHSAAHRPVTDDHPSELVTSDNWKEHARGQTGDEVKGDGIYLRVPLMVSDGATISAIEAGKRELSAGYTCDLDWTAGRTASGEEYDAVQKNIRINHVAVVHRGRAGSSVRIGDSADIWGISPVITDEGMKPMADNLRKLLVDGLMVDTTDAGAAAIEKLLGERTTAAKRFDDAAREYNVTLATKDEEIGALKAEVAKLKDAAPKPADIDRMVADRAKLVSVVKVIDAKIVVDGKTDDELRRLAVTSKLGEATVKDASPAEINGMFKVVAKDAEKNVDPIPQAIADGWSAPQGLEAEIDKHRQKMLNDMLNPELAN